MKPFGCHSPNRNGPVPTGCRCSASLFASMLRGTTAIVASDARRGADGSFSLSSTVRGSTAVAVSTAAMRLASGEAISLACTRRIVAATSSAAIGEPSWKTTFGRRVKR